MCIYSRTLYGCKHQAWGLLIRPCTIAHTRGLIHCKDRKCHGLHSKVVRRKCPKCAVLDSKMSTVRSALDDCRERLDRWLPRAYEPIVMPLSMEY